MQRGRIRAEQMGTVWELVPEAPPSEPGPWTGVACWPCPNEDAYENLIFGEFQTSQLRNLEMEPDGGHDHNGFSEMGSKDIDDLNKADGHVPMMVGKPPKVRMAVNRPCSSGSTTPRSTSTFVSLGGRNGPEEDNTESAVEVKLTAMRKRFAIPPSPRRLEREASGAIARSRNLIRGVAEDSLRESEVSLLRTAQSARMLPLRSPREDVSALADRRPGRPLPPRVAPPPFTMRDLSIYERR
ncbi:hypothetical protein FOZ63_002606 [Perkinsus olseni]|uniref:Uncharacterized protein n=1 Tax=Perkinsus olseni TaxID=32597 RepID=A0A7J6SHN2_PEROL|nr:hypothetical protein FOZ63_002606 [Perkinsus olseni]